MRTLVIMLALAVMALGCGGEKKGDEKKAEKKVEKKVEKKEAPAEEPAAEEPAKEEAPAEEPPAEEPVKEEAPAEEPAAEEPAKEEAPAEEPVAEEPAKEEAPAKLAELDLSKAYEDVPVVIMAPEGATAKEAFGVVEVRNGDGFQLQVSTEDSNGLAALKKEHQANTMNKLKQFVVDTPEAILYESEIMGRSEFHFAAYVKLDEEKWVYCEDNKGPTYTQAQVEAMYAACNSAKALGAAPAAAEEAPAEEGAAPAGEEAPAAAEEAPAEAKGTQSICDAFSNCCMAYADALSKVQGIPESAVTATKDGCKHIDQLKAMGAAAEQACQQGFDGMKQAGEAYKAMPGFVWPDACK